VKNAVWRRRSEISMTLAREYQRQLAWRHWSPILDRLPPLRGQTIFDLGCAVGDQAALLVDAGARVLGLDANEDLLRAARTKSLPGAEFRACDLAALPDDLAGKADGLWCSFAAAYFPDLRAALTEWSRALRPGGFVALTEVDDLFGHEPLAPRARSLLDAHASAALLVRRYDFHMGRKLRGHLEAAGFTVSSELVLADDELSSDGPVLPAVAEAWRSRFDRMQLLRDRAGADFEAVRDEFLACLSRADHRSQSKVICCIATK
jgi:SAM-dependent methyltransferase